MLNQLIYDYALWLDTSRWGTMLHESYYLYNWVETTHVMSLILSLGILFLIDLRMLGLALPQVPATIVARRLQVTMLIGFALMIITGLLLFFAVPVRSAQSVWFRIKFLLLLAAGVNALVFHYRMKRSEGRWDDALLAPPHIRYCALLSLLLWTLIVICGRLIAYDWFDCAGEQSGLIGVFAGCIEGQTHF